MTRIIFAVQILSGYLELICAYKTKIRVIYFWRTEMGAAHFEH